jgi:Tol biopolymer transport system component
MTTTRDPDRLLRAWLDLMPDGAPDRVVSAVLQAVEATPQVRGLRLLGPRRSPMNRLSLIAAIAVIAAALVGGALLLTAGQQPAPVAPTVHASASPAASTPKPSTLSLAAGYADLPGWIVFEHFGQAPDGSTSTFDADNRMIWLVHADGSGLHELAPGDPASGKASPDISPDGTKVTFESWSGHSAIYEVPIEGGSSLPVPMNCPSGTTCDGLDPAYSADGQSIAFVRVEFRGDAVSLVIAVTDLGTGKTTALESTRLDDPAGYPAQPSWSPDGSQIVYYRVLKTSSEEHPTDTRLFIAPTDDSATRELPQPPGAWAADPDWSPDGARIVFSTAPNRETEGWGFSNFHGMYTIQPDGSGLTQVCDTCLQGGWAPSWTPDGKHILFWGFRSWALMDADGKNAAHINQPKLTWFGDVLGYGYAGFLQPTT